jgi:Zn-dependent protease
MELLSGSILPIIFWMSLIFGFDTTYIAILTLLSAVMHEIGHGIAISLVNVKGATVKGHASGFRIRHEQLTSYKKEIVVLLFGPLVNILIFLLTLPLGNAMFGYVRVLGYVNLATGVSNLLPLEGYDGYGALCMLFCQRDAQHLIKRLEILSFILSILVTFASLHLIDVFGEGYWIFGLFFFTVLSKLAKFGKYDIFGE